MFQLETILESVNKHHRRMLFTRIVSPVAMARKLEILIVMIAMMLSRCLKMTRYDYYVILLRNLNVIFRWVPAKNVFTMKNQIRVIESVKRVMLKVSNAHPMLDPVVIPSQIGIK